FAEACEAAAGLVDTIGEATGGVVVGVGGAGAGVATTGAWRRLVVTTMQSASMLTGWCPFEPPSMASNLRFEPASREGTTAGSGAVADLPGVEPADCSAGSEAVLCRPLFRSPAFLPFLP